MTARSDLPPINEPLARRLDALLPQTQCGRCGYDGCLPYARALAAGETECNRCPPGGDETVAKLAATLSCRPRRIAGECGPVSAWRLARIDETRCIGCALCLAACPVDAIVGAARRMHTVIADQCTGCELCLAPCPVDCIDLLPMPWPGSQRSPVTREASDALPHGFLAWWLEHRAGPARARYRAHAARVDEARRSRARQREARRRRLLQAGKRAFIEAAVARARAKRARAPATP